MSDLLIITKGKTKKISLNTFLMLIFQILSLYELQRTQTHYPKAQPSLL